MARPGRCGPWVHVATMAWAALGGASAWVTDARSKCRAALRRMRSPPPIPWGCPSDGEPDPRGGRCVGISPHRLARTFASERVDMREKKPEEMLAPDERPM